MKTLKRVLFMLFTLAVVQACTSGKAALKQGDYYDAVLASVKRLRESPNNKKATQVLTQAYPLAIEFIDTNIQNGIKSDDPRKWRNAVEGYNKINYVNDQIKTSMGAMKLITNPQTRFKELAEAKEKAADEAYNEGVNNMMKNSRQDYKNAYFNFKDANDFKQGYRESIEMMNQAEFNATIRVAFEEINGTRFNYGTFQPVISSLQRLFLSFKPIAQKDTVPAQQYLRIIFNGYQENRPTISNSVQNYSDSVKIGEKTVNNQKVPVKEKITARVTIYEKIIPYSGAVQLFIKDARSNAELSNSRISNELSWSNRWASCTGDSRCIPAGVKGLCNGRESYPAGGQLITLAKKDLDAKLAGALTNFYRNY